jgi:hypothetical protein
MWRQYQEHLNNMWLDRKRSKYKDGV